MASAAKLKKKADGMLCKIIILIYWVIKEFETKIRDKNPILQGIPFLLQSLGKDDSF